ncbi:MAG: hypothetical protein NT162_03575, partial [Candidatus Woesebacteria bacterium]|nr:hypothetical protein [Candidatus Woesebacteria bacterium]
LSSFTSFLYLGILLTSILTMERRIPDYYSPWGLRSFLELAFAHPNNNFQFLARPRNWRKKDAHRYFVSQSVAFVHTFCLKLRSVDSRRTITDFKNTANVVRR